MFRLLPVALLAAAALGCAGPRLHFNQSFLASEDVKVGKSGYASLRSTGESFDFSPIQAQEPRVERIQLIKLRGAYFVVGEGFRHLWRIVPRSGDSATYAPVKLKPGPAGFTSPTLERSGACALLRWKGGHAYVDADGDVHAKSCD